MAGEPNGIAELACDPSAIAASERAQHFTDASQLLRELAAERQELPNGIAFRFAPDSFEAVARFIANERKCCPFASFEVTIAPAAGPATHNRSLRHARSASGRAGPIRRVRMPEGVTHGKIRCARLRSPARNVRVERERVAANELPSGRQPVD